MRREWTDAIKHRRWDEFERLAKWEPEQILCDTIAELERGVTEKADKKALKKVLWILEKAGFEPGEVENSGAPASAETAVKAVAFAMSADAGGDTPITYGMPYGGKFRWLTAYLHETRGITRASDDTMSRSEAESRIEVLRKSEAPPFLSGEIEPAYALWRIKRALGKNKPRTVPEAIAYWRSAIDKATELPHPSLKLKATKTKPAERAEDILLMDSTLAWRIELGAATPVLESMYKAQTENKDATEEEIKEAIKAAGVEARKTVLTPEILAEHVMRLRDLAYLMSLKEDPNFSKVLSSVQELEKLGSDSEYAKGLIDKTVVIYVETMKRSDEQAQQKQR
jgi:hypothetical protein